jgi:hypothetical protein
MERVDVDVLLLGEEEGHLAMTPPAPTAGPSPSTVASEPFVYAAVAISKYEIFFRRRRWVPWPVRLATPAPPAALAALGRRQLVGLESLDGSIPEGAMLVERDGEDVQGHVSAAALRVLEGGSIALGQLLGGFQRHGEELIATSPTRGQRARVRVVAPHFYDAGGERYRD